MAGAEGSARVAHVADGAPAAPAAPAAPTAPTAPTAPPGRPNILLVIADDHATHAMSCYGSTINQTPHLDAIAAAGMRFDACHCTNALCAPSRATILTGTYNHVNGVRTLDEEFDSRQVALPGLLHDAGYQTAIFGKWHLGHGPTHDPSGFDDWRVLDRQGDYYDSGFYSAAGREVRPGYVTDVITDDAVGWVEHRDRDRPYFLVVSHKAPHRPWVPDEAHAHLYDDVDIPAPPTLYDDYSFRSQAAHDARMRVGRDLTPDDWKSPAPPGIEEPDLTAWSYQRYIKDYLRCVAALDDAVGRLLAAVDAEGGGADTVVVYTSDQGFFLGDHGWYDKRFMYEESLQMPLLVRYPPLVAPGSTCDALVLNVDFAQTLLDLAGVPAPARMQGHSCTPLLAGVLPLDWRTASYYRYWEHLSRHHVPAHWGVRTKTHKLVYYHGRGLGVPGAGDPDTAPEWELFDLERDPRELHSRYDDAEYANVREELLIVLNELRAAVGDGD